MVNVKIRKSVIKIVVIVVWSKICEMYYILWVGVCGDYGSFYLFVKKWRVFSIIIW